MRTQNLKDYKVPKNWNRGINIFLEAIWLVIFVPLISSSIPGSYWRKIILKIFGAKLGKGIRLSSRLRVKMPWKLRIGNSSWIGEDVWIDNLDLFIISKNVCISQGVYFCSGNHNYKKTSFDLIYEKIIIESNVWIGAKSIIGPGVKIEKSSVVTMGSILTKNIPENTLFKNNKLYKLK